MKKRILTVFMIFSLLLGLVSCGAAMNGKESYDNAAPEAGEEPSYGILPDGEMPESPDAIPDEDYGKFIENEFIQTEIQNVSTFSADVDTASYSYFRKLVQSGYSLSELIATAGNSIRTEEMLNYFDYGYESPEGGELFSTKMQIAPCPWNSDAALLMLGLQTAKTESAKKNNLVFLIDVSGSMGSEDKLPLLQKSFAFLVDQLDTDDVISIVTYSGKEEIVLSGCAGSKKETILSAIRSLNANGATNGEAGLKKAYQLAEQYYIQDGNNRIIMASDGDLNVGISSVDQLKTFISEKRESGVFLSVLGFGSGNYKDAQMETIANCGNGVYYYIDSETEAEKIFGNEIFSTLYTVAKDVKLQMTFDPDSISAYRLVGYENRLLNKEDFENDTKDAGELGAGHSLTVCYELILKDTAMDTDSPWMTLGVRYKTPDGNKSEEQNYTFGKEVFTSSPDDNFKFVCAVIETSMILHESKFIGNITLSDVKSVLDSLPLSEDAYKAQFKKLIEQLL
ncbi:MAG: VWA domain-containing protein [Ruminococcaceae bacterium]|nr:VWA domain-containing protein [Oscillospiraceae bacterium]